MGVHLQAEEQEGERLPNVLPIGQPCIAQASLASLMPCDITLHDFSVEAPASNDQDSPGKPAC